ncbi:TetR/AcrR family transcriptional regulator [Streptomyces sp. CB09001]|uniref:ScbR family autoregulator-binding transcription factor n=1 Tax=unclassified Streptomyces TaxID=2593676 RepID=UPI000E2108DD|nr:ScbR family autoregulator-binding transcription factor [Streptomyces sp. CB09001]AXL92999.1 TetR/AcrR family transcriptional regulator [Streptomyces sp. CB09001]
MARQERATRTRLAILRSAAEVFHEVGYEAAAISEILKRSGTTKGALYFHFPSKRELAQEVLAEQLSVVPPVVPQNLVLQEGVDATLILAHMLRSGDGILRGSVRLTVEEGTPQDGLDRRVPMHNWVDHNREVLVRAEKAGEILPDVDIEAAAQMFVAGFAGAQLMSKLLSGFDDMLDRSSVMTKHLITSIAVPSVLVRLDFSPERGRLVYEQAVKLRSGAEVSASA